MISCILSAISSSAPEHGSGCTCLGRVAELHAALARHARLEARLLPATDLKAP